MTTKDFSDEFRTLHQIASASLNANVVRIGDASYLAAGSHQFGSFWTRDFCFAARGVIAIGRADVVRDHLSHLLRELRDDGLVPRILDYMPSWKRVVAHTALRSMPKRFKAFTPNAPLKAEHVGEHGTISIDSNALVLIVAQSLVNARPKDETWLDKYRPALQRVLDFMLARTSNATELVVQGRYEDWQDSASREGRTLYVNLLYAMAFEAGRELGLKVPAGTDGFLDKIRSLFFVPETGVFKSCENLDVISLDGNLLILNEPALEDLRLPDMYIRLKAHPLWSATEIPGVATVGDYPKSWVSWPTWSIGLAHYHDRFGWSWLMGLAAKAAFRSSDETEAARIFGVLERMAVRDQGIGEVYESAKRPRVERSSSAPEFILVNRILYRSELPFSWGAGCILESLSESLDDRR